MTARAILGLVVLNLGVLAVGAALLWGIAGTRRWAELLRLGGVAYFLGLASLLVVLTAELIVGIPFGVTSLVLSAGATFAGGVVLGRLRGHAPPRLGGPDRTVLSPAVALLIVPILLLFAALFRATRLQPLDDVDAWWVWTIRAKALFYFGDLGGSELVRGDITNYPSYPPGVSLVQAQAFDAMGGTDTVTLHLQHWFLAVGFVYAVVGLLLPRVRPFILFPFVLLLLVMPGFVDRVVTARADSLMGYFVAIAALLLCIRLEDGSRWPLVVAAVLLAGAMLTKREAAALVLCVVVAAVVTSFRTWRWSRRWVAAAAGVGLALAIPWRVSLMLADTRDAPSEGYFAALDHPERALPSLGLVARTIFDPMWLGLGALTVIGATLALAVGARRLPIFVLLTFATTAAAWSFVIWTETGFPITPEPTQNPVIRMVLALLLVVAPLTPMLFEEAWRAVTTPASRDPARRSSASGVPARQPA